MFVVVRDVWVESSLPECRSERARLAMDDSLGYVRRMGTVDTDRLLFSLSKTDGLSVAEVEEMEAARFNVGLGFVPSSVRERW